MKTHSMKNVLLLFLLMMSLQVYSEDKCTIKLKDQTLMHEMRETPSPLNNLVISDRNISFQWPLPEGVVEINSGLDGMASDKKKEKREKGKITYKIRFSKDKYFQKDAVLKSTLYPFYNSEEVLSAGDWYWQYCFVEGNNELWSDILHFVVEDNVNKFTPPPFKQFIEKLPKTHPRILIFQDEWDDFIKKSEQKPEREWYLNYANKVLKAPIVQLANAIDTTKVSELDNLVKQKALLTRESRRIVDKEEANIETLIRAFVLTKNDIYAKAAIQRLSEMITWKSTPYLVGDFNQATLLSLCSMAYDSFYSILSENEKELLLKEIKENGSAIFKHFNNRLENHIADNHNWQMNLRIFSMAAYAVYGELSEAEVWADYSYNLWLARFPGLNADGAWHNGDSYFHVNIRTLIEVPYFYSRVTGYDFFLDPWYKGSGMYVIYQQPPFSKSGGNGSSHQKILIPKGQKVGYADALSRLTNNSYLADYVNIIKKENKDILQEAFLAKPGDLSWFRLMNDKPQPKGKGLADLPNSHIFPQSGLASCMSNWKDLKNNAMLSFRSSPYGSTSHALANQNAFNTFFAGKSLFYSSGHHVSFTDQHSIYCHRGTRAHNTILVNGMGQKIGTEGYGWIPRYYTGEKIHYVLGDASNAYGKVISQLWLKRGVESDLEYTPENGWDENRLKTFRRHIVTLDDSGLVFIYDELEADTLVNWNYLLHTVENPITANQDEKYLKIRATNDIGVSDVYLFSEDKLDFSTTDKFFYPAINWLRADDEGNFASYENHWHFQANSSKKQQYRFAAIVHTHHKDSTDIKINSSTNEIKVNGWTIYLNLSSEGKPTFKVENKEKEIYVIYDGCTTIKENGVTTVLKDEVPVLEI